MSDPLRVLAKCLKSLQDVSGEVYYNMFPVIVAVGGQNAGKSSIIESIVGHSILPRGNDIVTRCPIHIRLHQVDEDDEVKIVFPSDSYSEKVILNNFDRVTDEINVRTVKRVGGTKNVSEIPILLDIFSPDYPDLQFIDLPGFTKTATHNQNSDICEQIERLNLPFMQNPNTIILAIQSATEDIAMSTALEYALREDVDPEGERTVGVLTKLDNVVAASDKDAVSRILKNQTKPLKYGYFGVVNRSQDSIDRGIGMDQTRSTEDTVFNDPAFRDVRSRSRLGTDNLRNFITRLLANKMEQMMPDIRQRAMDDLQNVTRDLKENGRFDDEGIDHDDLIAKLVERAMQRIQINLHGLSTKVVMHEEGTGAQLNKKIKNGALTASKEARQTYSVEDFHSKLTIAKKNVAAIRDNAFPEGIVLDIGVSLLTECYRDPFLQLLDASCMFLKEEVAAILKEALGIYPKFEELVTNIALEEIDVNKAKAEEYLNVQVDIHKRFVNCEHVEFVKMTQVLKKSKHRNHFNLWFKESIPTAEENGSTSGDSAVDLVENVADAALDVAEDLAPSFWRTGLRQVRGFFERLQDRPDNGKCNKLPCGDEDEALLHLDLCLEYMEIIDKALVDEIPKIFIMMLGHKLLDFLAGGESYGSSLLRKVQKEVKSLRAEDILVKSFAHEEMINDLKRRKEAAESTINVINRTFDQLGRFK